MVKDDSCSVLFVHYNYACFKCFHLIKSHNYRNIECNLFCCYASLQRMTAILITSSNWFQTVKMISGSESSLLVYCGKSVLISNCRCSGSKVILSRYWWRPDWI